MANDFVGMQVCPYCDECMGVLIQQNLKEIPKKCCTSPEPCDKCKAKFEKDGVVPVWEVTNPGMRNPNYTGRRAFFHRSAIKDEALIEMMNTVGFLICDKQTMDEVVNHYKKLTN